MAQVIVFPDVEDTLRIYLSDVLDMPAYAGVLPTTFPTEFLFVRRTGGPTRDLVTETPQVTLESRATRSGAAERNLQRAVAHVRAAAREGRMGEVTVYTMTDMSGLYLDPDPANPGHHRYSSTFQLAVRGHVI